MGAHEQKRKGYGYQESLRREGRKAGLIQRKDGGDIWARMWRWGH